MTNERTRSTQDDRGREADSPGQIPAAGWKDVALRVKSQVQEDVVPLLAAGVAFYAMLALFPALIALITLYGLVADPQEAAQQIEDFAAGLPEDIQEIVSEQAANAAGGAQAGLSLGLAASLAGVLWSASSGMNGLIQGVNAAYDEQETRKFPAKRGLALLLTLGGMVFFIVTLLLIAVVPALLGNLGLGDVAQTVINWARWPVLAVLVMLALAVVYRVAPDRDTPQMRWVSWGAVIATVLWLLASAAFSIYVSNFGDYNETYGTLGGVIILLLWLFLSGFVVLLGAEINAEIEAQTVKDTTKGEPEPMGQRHAQKADHLGDSAD